MHCLRPSYFPPKSGRPSFQQAGNKSSDPNHFRHASWWSSQRPDETLRKSTGVCPPELQGRYPAQKIRSRRRPISRTQFGCNADGALLSEFDRITDEVNQHLPKPQGITQELARQVGISLTTDLQAFLKG